MQKRGRKSVAELSIVASNRVSGLGRVEPPLDLTETEASAFRRLVASCPASHFVPSDMPLIVSYVQATLVSRRAASLLEEDASYITIWEKATRMQATLATRLRLAPQARSDPKTISRRAAGYAPSAYDTMEF
jgi:hypothetical protein